MHSAPMVEWVPWDPLYLEYPHPSHYCQRQLQVGLQWFFVIHMSLPPDGLIF